MNWKPGWARLSANSVSVISSTSVPSRPRQTWGLSALKNLEAGKGTTLKTLLKVLKALDRVNWLDALTPTVSVSPLRMLRATQPRQRVYAPRGKRDGAAG